MWRSLGGPLQFLVGGGASKYHGGLGELSGVLHTVALLYSLAKVFLVIYLLILQSISTVGSDHEQQS